MIRLGLFMLDPVKAHALYLKEVEELRKVNESYLNKNKSMRAQVKALEAKLKSRTGMLTVVQNKLHEERKGGFDDL